MVTFDDFAKLDIRVGEIVRVETFPKAKRPAFKLWVDFGDGLGIRRSSAQITEVYSVDELLGRQVLGVVNLPPKQIADFVSEALVLGVYSMGGVVLIRPDQPVTKGDRLG